MVVVVMEEVGWVEGHKKSGLNGVMDKNSLSLDSGILVLLRMILGRVVLSI